MYKGRDIIGKPIVSYDRGEKFDTIADLIFDQESNQLLGFLVRESTWFSSAQILRLQDVQAIGPDAVITSSKHAIADVDQTPEISQIVNHNNILKGTRILTMDGRDLGTMIDFYFDEQTGSVEGYEVSGGIFADAYSGRSFVPAVQTLKIGKDVAFVPVQTAQLMEEQVGGIKAVVQTASHKMQETAQVAGEKIQDFGRIAGEKAQDTASVAEDKLQEFGRRAATLITDTVVDPMEQKTFVIGRTAEHDVITPDGQLLVYQGQIVTQAIANSAEALYCLDMLYRATGGRVTHSLSQRVGNQLGSAVAGLTVEQAYGRRIQHVVRSDEGSIIAALGQIVTEQVIERSKIHHQEQALLQAVGLSPSSAARSSTSSTFNEAGGRLKSATQSTGAQFQSGAKNVWAQVKETASELQDRGSQVIEEKRIQGALGRAVTRVILDQNDAVILNVGELITHQAIASARQAKVLDLLLSSVYSETPKLSLEDLRAPQPGKDALPLLGREDQG